MFPLTPRRHIVLGSLSGVINTLPQFTVNMRYNSTRWRQVATLTT